MALPLLHSVAFLLLLQCTGCTQIGKSHTLRPDPVTNPYSPIMLEGSWLPDQTQDIDFDGLTKIPSKHVVVSDVSALDGVNQHNYLIHHLGKFWVMWSDGPGVEDRVGQRVKFATSEDCIHWSESDYITPEPPLSGSKSKFFNTRSDQGFRWISRGFWNRDGELIALASLDEAAGFFGPSLALHAFRFDSINDSWEEMGVVRENAINNFPPKKIPTGEWMISQRPYDYREKGVYFLVGGIVAIDHWQAFPVLGSSSELFAEEPFWWELPDHNLMVLFRDNRKSGYLYRSFSIDHGRSWTKPIRTNFPDATSKINGTRLNDGRYLLVSNPNPAGRDPLALAISADGMVFSSMGYLVGGHRVDYPHVLEHKDFLLIAFSSNKQTVEILKIQTKDLSVLEAQGRH